MSARLTPEEIRHWFKYDPDTGHLTWRISPTSQKSLLEKPITGTDREGYLRVKFRSIMYAGHRVIWAYQTGRWPSQIDHINGIRGDNRWENLREATPRINTRNMAKTSRNTSGQMGVSWDKSKNRWVARIGASSNSVFLGCFESYEEAVAIRLKAESQYGYSDSHGRRQPKYKTK